MVICIYISVSVLGACKCPCHFVVKFWLSGSIRVRVEVKTSVVTDTENETVLAASLATVPSRLDGTVVGEATLLS